MDPVYYRPRHFKAFRRIARAALLLIVLCVIAATH